MAKRNPLLVNKPDFTSWNFILFLTLAFVLMVIILGAIGKTTEDLRSRAGLTCPTPTLPPVAGCSGVWRYTQNAATNCPSFVCEVKWSSSRSSSNLFLPFQVKSYPLYATCTGMKSCGYSVNRKRYPMEVRRKCPYGFLCTLFPLSAGNSGVVGVLPSHMSFFAANITLIGHNIKKIQITKSKFQIKSSILTFELWILRL